MTLGTWAADIGLYGGLLQVEVRYMYEYMYMQNYQQIWPHFYLLS